ncbi:MAG: DUF2442 domain-containing protein [Pyramidobacter sp.]|jgi:hypothetical protein
MLTLIRVKEVKPIEEYRLLLTFTNGKRKIYDVKPLLHYKAFKPLHNEGFFNAACTAFGSVVWNDKIDIAPEELYENSHAY